MEYGSIAVYTVIIAVSILSMLAFWIEHNHKNGISPKENKLAVKWVATTLIGAIITCLAFYPTVGCEALLEPVIGQTALIAVFVSIAVTKIACEGIGAFAKWLKDRAVEAKEAESTINDVVQMLAEMKAENAEIKKRIGVQ